MHLHDILCVEFKRFDEQPINIVETGTIRGTTEASRVGDGWSTQFFAQHVRKFGGKVFAIDLKPDTVPMVLSGDEMQYVQLVTDHSISALTRLVSQRHEIEVAFLDSDNDAQLIFHEFLIAEQLVKAGGLVIVDDVRLPDQLLDDHAALKGERVWPWLKEYEYEHRIYTRDGWAGYRTGVLVIEV